MTRAEKMIDEKARWMDDWQYNDAGFDLGQEDLLDLIQQTANRTLEEVLKKSKTILVRGLQTEIVFAHDIRSCRWWEEEIKLPGFKDIIGLFKDGEDEEA